MAKTSSSVALSFLLVCALVVTLFSTIHCVPSSSGAKDFDSPSIGDIDSPSIGGDVDPEPTKGKGVGLGEGLGTGDGEGAGLGEGSGLGEGTGVGEGSGTGEGDGAGAGEGSEDGICYKKHKYVPRWCCKSATSETPICKIGEKRCIKACSATA